MNEAILSSLVEDWERNLFDEYNNEKWPYDDNYYKNDEYDGQKKIILNTKAFLFFVFLDFAFMFLCFFVIIDPNKKNVASILFKRLWIFLFINLIYCCFCIFVPL